MSIFYRFRSITVLKAVEEWDTSYDTVFEIIPPCVTAIGSITKYMTPVISASKVRKLFAYMKDNCKEYAKLPQRGIMKEYAVEGRQITTCYIGVILIFSMVYGLMPLEPVILGILKPLNESRKKKLLFPFKIFVDEQDYYIPIMMYQYLASFVTIYQLIAADALFLMFIQHACASFMIAGNYIKHLHILEGYPETQKEGRYWAENDLKHAVIQERMQKMYRKLKYGIVMHQKTVTYCNIMESMYTVSLAILLLFNVALISSTGLQLITHRYSFGDTLRYGSFISGQLFHLFFICLPGQRLVDHSENFYGDVCAGSWYMYSKEVSVLYKLIILRSSTFSRLTVGKIATLGMEINLKVIQTAVSYFTVLSSMQ